jgi:hypothetical protein
VKHYLDIDFEKYKAEVLITLSNVGAFSGPVDNPYVESRKGSTGQELYDAQRAEALRRFKNTGEGEAWFMPVSGGAFKLTDPARVTWFDFE